MAEAGIRRSFLAHATGCAILRATQWFQLLRLIFLQLEKFDRLRCGESRNAIRGNGYDFGDGGIDIFGEARTEFASGTGHISSA
jgi:hypothetical protein